MSASGGPVDGDLFHDATGDLRAGWKLLAFGALLVVLTVVGLAFLPFPGIVAQSAVLLAASLAAGWILLDWADDRGPGALGFYLHRDALVESVLGLALGTAVALAAVAVMAAVGVVRWTGDGGTAADLVTKGAGTLAFLALPAAAEEALFRGYPLQLLARAWGRGRALVATSLGFGLLHWFNPGLTAVAMLNLVVAGAFLGVVYLKTASLWWATAAHLGWNWAHGFLTDLPVSGLELVDTPLWDGMGLGPDWLGGGSFGPEGSVLTTGVVVAATAVFWWGPWLRPGRGARASEPLTPLPGDENTTTDEERG